MMADDNTIGSGFDLGAVPNLAPDTGQREQLTGEAGQFVGPSSRLQQLGLRADWNYFESSPSAALTRWLAEKSESAKLASKGQLKWSADKLNEYYKGQGVAFTEDEYPEIAALRIAQRSKEKELNDYVARGKPWGAGWELLSGTVQMLDPVNLAGNVVGGWAIQPLLKGVNMSTFGKLMVENALVNLATDIPTYHQLKKEFSDVSIGETVAGSMIGAGVASGIGLLMHNRALRAQAKRTAEAKARDVAEGVGQAESGSKIDVTNSPFRFMGEAIANGDVQQGVQIPSHEFAPISHPSEVPFFVTKEKGSLVTHGEHGQAVYGSDSAFASNNKGDFSEVRISPEAKILNSSMAMEHADADVFKMAVEMKMDRFGVQPIEMKNGATLEDFFRRLEVEEDAGNLPEGVTASQIVRETAQELGYDGISSVHKVNGNPRHNKLAIFNDKVISEGRFVRQNPDLVPKINPEDLARYHEEYVSKIQNREGYDAELIAQINHLKSRPDMTPEQVKTFIKEHEIRTRTELKKLLAKASEEQFELPMHTQGELELKGGRTAEDIAVTDLKAQQELYDSVMKQIDDFIDAEQMKETVARITDDELGRMKQQELQGLRGTATQKPTFRRSNLPDKDVLARMSVEEYRKSIKAFADEQPDMFAMYYIGNQGELDLKPVPFKPEISPEESLRFQNTIQEALALPEGKAAEKIALPPEAPTPQTRNISVGSESASINKPKLEQVSKNINEIADQLTPEQIEQIKNHTRSDATREIVEAEIAEIDLEFEAKKAKLEKMKMLADCMMQGIT